jgi:3-oxoacyl-[acyl-carrier-protein] synthase-3
MSGGEAWRSARRIAVAGTGWALPGDPVSSDDLIATMVDRFGFAGVRSAQAIARRLGVTQRHIGRAFAAAIEAPRHGQSNPDLAAAALTAALADAGLRPRDLGYVIAHTATPAQSLPPNVAVIADLIGFDGPTVELRQACTGFGNALMIASGLIAAEPNRPVAIVGSETGTQFFDPRRLSDMGQIVNMMQMGDGAGAIILSGAAPGMAAITASWFGGIGRDRAPGISRGATGTEFAHDFAAIRATGHRLFDAGAEMAATLGCAPADADHVIPHQVSGHIGDLVAAHLGLRPERMVVTADRHGNTGSAAIWLALAHLRAGGLASRTRVLALGAEASKHYHAGFIYEHR